MLVGEHYGYHSPIVRGVLGRAYDLHPLTEGPVIVPGTMSDTLCVAITLLGTLPLNNLSLVIVLSVFGFFEISDRWGAL